MKYNRLGDSDLLVSEVCFGTMTFAIQSTEEEAHELLDYARSRGVNFFDTAELYPARARPDVESGESEKYIGTYLAKHPEARSEMIIASKVMGFSPNSKEVTRRNDPPFPTEEPYPDACHDAKSIKAACEASLRRLQTDYIDLYQLHWPDRYVPLFGDREYRKENERDAISFKEILLGLKDLLDAGKIRHWGVSNESTFGVCEFVRVAKEIGMPGPVTIQNAFCLLNRQFESELAEACSPRNFNIGLLPWSIMAGGVLSGKYQGFLHHPNDRKKASLGIENCRYVMYPHFQARFMRKESLQATEKYIKLAEEYDMSPATLAQAFCKSRWYIPSSIIGASKLEQLKKNIDAFEIDLDEEVLKKIDAIHNENKDTTLGV